MERERAIANHEHELALARREAAEERRRLAEKLQQV